MSSSDSEDERIQQLAASIDPQFNYNGTKQITEIKPISLRPQKWTPSNELNTTPEFRNYVAKKLTEIIDSKVKIVTKHQHSDEEAEIKEKNGIRLLSTCRHFTSIDNEERPKHKQRKPNLIPKRRTSNSGCDSSDESDDEATNERLSSVAVSCDWVLKGSASHQIAHSHLLTSLDQVDGEDSTNGQNSKTKSKKKKKKKDKVY